MVSARVALRKRIHALNRTSGSGFVLSLFLPCAALNPWAPQVDDGAGSPDQNMVLAAIKQATDDTGVSVQSIVQSLNGRLGEAAIRCVLQIAVDFCTLGSACLHFR